MPTLARRSCLVPTCAEPAGPGGRCPAHSTIHRRTLNTDGDERLYRTARWRRLRAQVIHEQPFCAEPGCPRLTAEVHHRVKRADNLPLFYERTNVEGLCRPHHAQRTRRGE
jgi:5-methylcytosine-specific restriction endonuclease McrA